MIGRRARAQWPLLGCLLVVLTLGSTLLGTSALLMTRTSERAIEVAAARADPDGVRATAFTVTISAENARAVADDARAVLTSAVAPITATTATRASGVMQRLPMASDESRGLLGEGYLSGDERLAENAALVSGRWPRTGTGGGAALETVLFENTARLLGVRVGSRIRLGTQLGRQPAAPVSLTVVGVVRPLPDAGWDRDVLNGTGYDPEPADVSYAADVNAYGPFLVTLDDLLGSGSSLEGLEVTARPDLSETTGRDLDRLTAGLLAADRKLSGTLGDRAQYARVTSPVPQLLTDFRRQQQLIAGTVLAFALIGFVLTAIALALAGRLTTGVRAEESALLAALGFSPRQLARLAVVEAAALTVVAVAVAVPASAALHAALTHLPPLSDAGLAADPAVTVAQVLAVTCGALALAVLHVVLAVRPATDSGDRRKRRELLARSGADVLLGALAVVGWWQLRAQSGAADTRADVVRVLAPALILVACVALVLRLLPPALRRAERLAERGRGLVLPLAAFQAARRQQAFAAGLLIGLACAAATFGTAFGATWNTSQHDQADLRVGTDLRVELDEPAPVGQSAVVGAATGGALSPVAVRNVSVGQWLGDPGSAPQLVALDTRRADALLRGRTDGTWAAVTKALAPSTEVTGPELPRGATPVVTGTATVESFVVTPRLLLQDAAGLRTVCEGPPVALDGRPHPVSGCAPVAGLRLVAVTLPVAGGVFAPEATLDVTVALPRGTAFPAPWTLKVAAPGSGQVSASSLAAAGSSLRFRASMTFSDPLPQARELVATTFGDPVRVPVVVSERFAAEVHAAVGSTLDLNYGTTPVDVVVVGVVPVIPSVPDVPAALADEDALSRALVHRGDLDPHVTAWWAGNPRAGADAAVRRLGIGEVTTRASEAARLTDGPLRASLPAVLRVLVAAAALLLLGGVVLYVAYDVQLRALEVARLRGLGMSRRDIRSALLAEHAAVLVPLLVAGALIGAAANWVVAPLLIRSDTGAAPVPPTVADWPWALEAGLLGALLAGSALAVFVVVTVQARRADAAHLRVAS